MKKIVAVATMVFVSTVFASTALAGEGYYIQEKMRKEAEKRIVQYEKENKKEKSTKSENKTEQKQDIFKRFSIVEAKGGR